MEINTFKNINETEIKDELKAKIQKLYLYDYLYNKTIVVLNSFEGKKPSKRIMSAVYKELPLYSVSVRKHDIYPEWYTVTIWGNGLSWSDALRINISSEDYPVINIENILNINQSYNYTSDQIFKDKKALKNIKNYCKKYLNIQEKIKKFGQELEEVNNAYIFSK